MHKNYSYCLWSKLTRVHAVDALRRFIVKKGYVAVDGTSLTVTTVDPERSRFSVMLIAHT